MKPLRGKWRMRRVVAILSYYTQARHGSYRRSDRYARVRFECGHEDDLYRFVRSDDMARCYQCGADKKIARTPCPQCNRRGLALVGRKRRESIYCMACHTYFLYRGQDWEQDVPAPTLTPERTLV